MGIRDALNNKKTATGAIAGVVVLIGLGAVGYQAIQIQADRPQVPGAFYTVDDGTTLFKDTASRAVPFDHDGKQAVRAYVFQAGDKQFVAFLERYTADALKAFAAAEAAKSGQGKAPAQRELEAAGRYGREVKRPGDKQWVKITSPEGVTVSQKISPPAGMSGAIERIIP